MQKISFFRHKLALYDIEQFSRSVLTLILGSKFIVFLPFCGIQIILLLTYTLQHLKVLQSGRVVLIKITVLIDWLSWVACGFFFQNFSWVYLICLGISGCWVLLLHKRLHRNPLFFRLVFIFTICKFIRLLPRSRLHILIILRRYLLILLDKVMLVLIAL